MKPKLVIFAIFVIGLIAGVSAAEFDIDDEYVEPLVIAFLVLCAVVLVVAIIVTLCFVHRSRSGKTIGGKYNMSKRESRLSSGTYNESVGVYGYYTDPKPSGSIYLPLSDRKNNEENGYAHLSHSAHQEVDKEGQHTYETLKTENTFKKENAYDNPGAIIDDEKTGDDKKTGNESDGSDHDYELADANVKIKGHDYENPVEVESAKNDTAF